MEGVVCTHKGPKKERKKERKIERTAVNTLSLALKMHVCWRESPVNCLVPINKH